MRHDLRTALDEVPQGHPGLCCRRQAKSPVHIIMFVGSAASLLLREAKCAVVAAPRHPTASTNIWIPDISVFFDVTYILDTR
jgi:hypothetical protein